MAKDKICRPFVGIIAPENKFTVDTIDDLKSRNYLTIGDVVELNGYYTAGDGAHHKRKIESADDGSGVQLANGLWANIVHNGKVNVSWFGAKGDGITDDTASIKRCIESYDNVNFSAKTYIVNNLQISKNKNIGLFGLGVGKTFIKSNSDEPVIFFKNDISRTTIDGFTIIGNKGENSHGIKFYRDFSGTNITNIRIESCRFGLTYKNCWISNIKNIDSYFGRSNEFFEGSTLINSGTGATGGSVISTSTTFENCYANAYDVGFKFQNSIYSVVIKCYADYCNFFTKGNGMTFLNCGCENISDTIFYISGGTAIIKEFNASFVTSKIYHVGEGRYNKCSLIDTNSRYHMPGVKTLDELSSYETTIIDNKLLNSETQKNKAFFELNNVHLYTYNSNSNRSQFYSILVDTKTTITDKNERTKTFVIETNKDCNASYCPQAWTGSDGTRVNGFKFSNFGTDFTVYTYPTDSVDDEARYRTRFDFAKKGDTWYCKRESYNTKRWYPITPIIKKCPDKEDTYYFLMNKPYGTTYLQDFRIEHDRGSFRILTSNLLDEDSRFDKMSEIKLYESQELIFVNEDVLSIESLDTQYYTMKMQQEGVYEDFIAYMDSQHEYDKEKKALESAKQEAYQLALAENSELVYEEWLSTYAESMPIHQEPVPSEALQAFYNEYK